jgi:hypothetical protein
MDNKIVLSAKNFHDILKLAYSLGFVSGQQSYPSDNVDLSWNSDISEVYELIMSQFNLDKVQ